VFSLEYRLLLGEKTSSGQKGMKQTKIFFFFVTLVTLCSSFSAKKSSRTCVIPGPVCRNLTEHETPHFFGPFGEYGSNHESSVLGRATA
jgi:hypothetical protein